MDKIAIFPGSFDPFTIGHESIVRRGLHFFDKIIIAIGYNSNKPGYFPLETRKEWINTVFANQPAIRVASYTNLTVEFCKENNSRYILRGLRTAADFEYERAIAQVNKKMMPELETVFLLTTPEFSSITSTIVRDIIRHGGDASPFLPKGINVHNHY
jgi:pantetheine-phosphate adenylyltransferase